MKLKIFATFALVALSWIHMATAETETKKDISAIQNSVRVYPTAPHKDWTFAYYAEPDTCGGNLIDSKGGISYKAFFSADPNERCVWFIQAGNATIYELEIMVRNDCVSPNPNKLIISTFRHGYNATHHYPNSDTKLIVDGEVIMVTFYTPHNSTNNCQGFILRYTAKDGGLPSVGQPHHFKLQDETAMSYPNSLGSPEYSNNELTCFLFGADENLYHSDKANNACYRKNSLEGATCFDHVTFYKFGVYTKWQVMQRICGQVVTQQIRNDDLLLAVFESDGSETGAGFQLSYNSRC